MASIKTAISIEKGLFQELGALAEEMSVSRSYLFALAAREFIQRYRGQRLLEAINAAYDDVPDPGEEKRKTQMRSRHRELVRGQW